MTGDPQPLHFTPPATAIAAHLQSGEAPASENHHSNSFNTNNNHLTQTDSQHATDYNSPGYLTKLLKQLDALEQQMHELESTTTPTAVLSRTELSVESKTPPAQHQNLPNLDELLETIETIQGGGSPTGIVSGGTLFEELGFSYVGPIDGHDLDNLVPILENIRDDTAIQKPILLHIKTVKGQGYPPALAASDTMHGVAKFDVATGKQQKGAPGGPPALTTVFASELVDIAKKDDKVVGITAAMPGGTGMDIFGRAHPTKMFDVGIAEQHAVTMAAGMAAEGLKPFCAIYSTFMQRGYDQVVHDVVLQNLPVRMMLDRGGLVGNDGPTHHGTFDLTYMGALPNLVLMAPSDELELQNAVQTVYGIDDQASCVRFPRGAGYGLEALNEHFGYGLTELPGAGGGKAVPIGKGRVIKPARAGARTKVAVLSLGTRLMASVLAAKGAEAEYADVGVTVADARFMKPLDTELIRELARDHDALITVEENMIGGFGDHVLHFMALDGLLDNGKCKVRPMVIPDQWIEAGTQTEQYDEAGLNAQHIQGTIARLANKIVAPALEDMPQGVHNATQSAVAI